MAKTASGLIAYCKAQLGLPYWWGTFGQTASAALYREKKAQYPNYYTASDFASQYGKRVHDCVGLIKGYRWSETPTSAPVYRAAQDVAVSGLLAQCSERGGIKTMPDQPGVCVFMSGHVGVYIGGGEVIEARGHAYGVVKTKLSGRGWTNWGKPDWITYDTETGGKTVSTNTTITTRTTTAVVPYLTKGYTGESVKALQILLIGIGYPCGSSGADGDFGAGTAAAVKLFQTSKGLTADGIVGAATWRKLLGL